MRETSLLSTVALVISLLSSHAAYAEAPDPEEACQKGRYAAAAKYSACEQKATADLVGAGVWASYFPATSKCHLKYARTWAKLQAKADGNGTVCDNPRFGVNGDGTVTDRLTGLQWEMKTDDDGIHDKDDLHTWSAAGTAADGTAYTTFLATLNGGSFAGQADWRLPRAPSCSPFSPRGIRARPIPASTRASARRSVPATGPARRARAFPRTPGSSIS